MVKTPFKILMADDDPDDCMIVRDAFKEVAVGIDFTCVENGIELLDYLKRQDKYAGESVPELPHLILLDLNMPEKDGWESFHLMHAVDPMIPVIIITARPGQQAQAKRLGTHSLMEKPLNLPQLLETIRRALAETMEIRARR